jgi:hypothetical protein
LPNETIDDAIQKIETIKIARAKVANEAFENQGFVNGGALGSPHHL